MYYRSTFRTSTITCFLPRLPAASHDCLVAIEPGDRTNFSGSKKDGKEYKALIDLQKGGQTECMFEGFLIQ